MEPTVVQGTAVASPYDHHTKQDDAAPQNETRDPTGPGVGTKQVSSSFVPHVHMSTLT